MADTVVHRVPGEYLPVALTLNLLPARMPQDLPVSAGSVVAALSFAPPRRYYDVVSGDTLLLVAGLKALCGQWHSVH